MEASLRISAWVAAIAVVSARDAGCCRGSVMRSPSTTAWMAAQGWALQARRAEGANASPARARPGWLQFCSKMNRWFAGLRTMLTSERSSARTHAGPGLNHCCQDLSWLVLRLGRLSAGGYRNLLITD